MIFRPGSLRFPFSSVTMILYFVETEPEEKDFFRNALPGHDVRIVSSLSEVGEDAEGLSTFIYATVDRHFIESHPRLRLIATRSTGYDHIDLEACRERDITVCNVPYYGNNTVAEHTMGLLLALARRLKETLTMGRNPGFSFKDYRGFDLEGKTLGIVGTGHIGMYVIRMAKAFGMDILGYDIQRDEAQAAQLGFRYVPLDELLTTSDIISLHVPLFPSTYHLLNRERLAKTKRGVVILNTSRGALIDTEALIEALDSGHVAGAGLDVMEEEQMFHRETVHLLSEQIVQRLHEDIAPGEIRTNERIGEIKRIIKYSDLVDRPNVLFTSHTAFNSVEAVGRINKTTVENITTFLNGSPQHRVL